MHIVINLGSKNVSDNSQLNYSIVLRHFVVFNAGPIPYRKKVTGQRGDMNLL